MESEGKADEYRMRAKRSRDLAEKSDLPKQKEMHIRCAETWEERAKELEQIERLKAIYGEAMAAKRRGDRAGR